MKHTPTLLLTAAVILSGLTVQAREAVPNGIGDIHKALRKAPSTSLLVGTARYALVNDRYEECISTRMARREGNYIKCVTPADQGWSVVIVTLSGARVMEGGSLDAEGKVLHGDCVYYDANGQLRAQGRYVHGLKTGTWSRYDANGKRLSDKDYYGEDWDAMQVRVGLASLSRASEKGPILAGR